MAKLKLNEKRVQLSFQRPDDVALYAFLEKRAYERRYDLPTFILLSLHEAFEGQVETPAAALQLANEAANKLMSGEMKWELSPAKTALDVAPIQVSKSEPESTDDGYESTKAAIAANNALYLKKAKPRKGTIPGAPDTAPASPPASPK